MTDPLSLICTDENCHKQFRVIPQELKLYEVKGLPLPKHCPSCRHRQRMALRSERALYRRKCAKCNEQILSVYPETAPYLIYCQPCFWANIG